MKPHLPFIELDKDRTIISAFNIPPPENCFIHKDFPNCCPFHSENFKVLKNWISNNFPNCCEHHRELSKKFPLKKETYQYVPEKILIQLIFTEKYIKQHIDKPNWYKDITYYITLNRISFGHPAIGSDRYIDGLEQTITKSDLIDTEKKERLLQYLNPNYKLIQKNCERTNLNVLYLIFQKWLATFPDLRHFERWKKRLHKKFPSEIIFYDQRHFEQIGLTLTKVRTEKELVNILVKSTKKLLSGLDSAKLVQTGVIKDISSYQMETINEHHRLRQKKLLEEYTNKEIKYVKTIEKWLSNEKEYFSEIEPYIKKTNNSQDKNNIRKKEMTFLELFRNNQDKVDKFFKILRTERLDALDEDNNWIYQSTKSSIVACFEALKDLEIIKPSLSKAKLQRVVASQVHFEGNEKLFRNGFKSEDYKEFYGVFKTNLK